VGIKAIDWNYPAGNSLSELIDRANLHPVTSLTSLTKAQKRLLLDNGIVLCREISKNPELLSSIITDKVKITRILKETKELCNGRNNI
jgi:hypothetical protein